MSIIAFSVGMIGSILVYSLGKIYDKIVGLFLGFVSFMQLVDFFLWRNQSPQQAELALGLVVGGNKERMPPDQICNRTNYITSIIGIILNHLQPIVLGIIILCVNTELSYQDIKNIFWILLVYLCVMVPYTWQCVVKTQCTLKDSNNHMDWKWNYLDYWVLVYFVFLMTLFMLYYWFVPVYGMFFAFVTLYTFLLSAIFYNKEMGNMWCFFTIFLPILYYFFPPDYLCKKYPFVKTLMRYD
jgi:hypothetical protein